MTVEQGKATGAKAIVEAALRIFSREELTEMPRPQRLSLFRLIGKRLEQPGPMPTQDELEGFKELVTEHLWHGALNKHATTL